MLEELKKKVYEANMELPRRGLITYTWGNVSGIDRDTRYFVIKPSGVDYDKLRPEDMVVMDLEGNRFYPGAGLIPSQAPCYVHNVLPVPGMGSFFDIIPWGSSGILGVKWHYLFYGDKQVIADNYEMGKKYLEHLKTKQNAEGFLNYGLGDW